MTYSRPLLLMMALFAETGLATPVITGARAQTKEDLDTLLCERMYKFDRSNDLGPCNRNAADKGWSPLGRVIPLEMRARAYTVRGYFDLAIRDYGAILSLLNRHMPRDSRIGLTYFARGRVFEVKGDFQAAEMDYRRMMLEPQHTDYGRRFLEDLNERRAGIREGPIGGKLHDKLDLDRDDLRQVLSNNTIFAATARDAEPWRAYFGGDGSMANVYANGTRKNGRWSMDAGNAVCMTLEGASQECRRLARMVLYAYNMSTYYLWIDTKSGKITSHIFESRPGKFIDRAE
jgi:hypothetical protein